MKNKKAISPVVATSLLLVVAVVAVVNFQTFFNSFQSGIQTGIEKDSQGGVIDLNYLDPVKLYVVNPTNDTITYSDIKISGKSCGLSGNFSGSGISEINLGFCTTNMAAGYKSIALITNKGVFAETLKMTSAGIVGNITLQCDIGTDVEIFSFFGNQTEPGSGLHAEIASYNTSNSENRLCVAHNSYTITTTCTTSENRLFYLGATNSSHMWFDNSTAYDPGIPNYYNWQEVCLESSGGTVNLTTQLNSPGNGEICITEYIITNASLGGIVGNCDSLVSKYPGSTLTNKTWLDIT